MGTKEKPGEGETRLFNEGGSICFAGEAEILAAFSIEYNIKRFEFGLKFKNWQRRRTMENSIWGIQSRTKAKSREGASPISPAFYQKDVKPMLIKA